MTPSDLSAQNSAVTAFPENKSVASFDHQLNLTVRRTVLDNGLTVVVTPLPWTTTVSVFALVKTGSAVEGEFLGSGISHFLEHMVFKGTERRKVGQISAEVQAMGGTINASTSFDYTIYTITVPADMWPRAVDILADMLGHPKFDPKEIDKEREVVYGEMRLYEDNPDRRLSRLLLETVYQVHPYRVPIIGYRELLASLSREDFVRYHRQRYIPNNMVVAVSGRVDADEAIKIVQQHFGSLKRGVEPVRLLPQEAEPIGPRERIEEYPTDFARLAVAFPTVSVLDEDMYALDALARILGVGESSRLYQELFAQRHLVRRITAAHFTPIDKGVFEIEAALDAPHIPQVRRHIEQMLATVASEGVDPEELDKIKRQMVSELFAEFQTSDSVAWQTAYQTAFLADPEFSRLYVRKIQSLTAEDIKRVARRYLTPDRASTVMIVPTGQSQTALGQEKTQKEVSSSEIIKEVLPNGMTLLFKQDASLPFVNVTLALNGGTRYEDERINGLSALTAGVWPKATKDMAPEQLSEAIESRGAVVSGFSGRNSVGLRIKCLKDDAPFFFDLLAEFVNDPVILPQEVEKEKIKLKTALMARSDRILQVAFQTLREHLFKTPPFKLDEIGTMESIERLSADDVVSFLKQQLKAQGTVVSVFGDFDIEEMKMRLKDIFGSWPAEPPPAVEWIETPPLTQTIEKRLPKQQAVVAVGFHAPSIYAPQRPAVDVATAILGSPFNGWIFAKVREVFGQAYSLGGSYTPARDMGFVGFYVLTSAREADRVEKILKNLIKKLQRSLLSDEEIQEYKNYLKGTHEMGLQTLDAQSFTAALEELYGLGYDHFLKFPDEIQAVTPKQVQEAAKRYFNLDNAVWVKILPENPQNQEPMQPAPPSDIHTP